MLIATIIKPVSSPPYVTYATLSLCVLFSVAEVTELAGKHTGPSRVDLEHKTIERVSVCQELFAIQVMVPVSQGIGSG
jgi:hypothetical protein